MKALLAAMLLLFTPLSALAEGCTVSGCSGELCVEEGQDMASICIFNESYRCYKTHSNCERQKNGTCGWTQNEALQQCIAKANQSGGADAPLAQ